MYYTAPKKKNPLETYEPLATDGGPAGVIVSEKFAGSARAAELDAKMSKSIADSPAPKLGEEEIDTNKNGLSKYAAAAGSVANFGMDVYKGANTTAGSDKEADARTMNLTMSGMSTGAAVGSIAGPLGTAIGAGAGAIIGGVSGMLMKVPDRKKRVKEANEAYEGKLFHDSYSRRMSAEDAQKEQELEYLMDLQKASMGHVKF